jgi:hypothetical protein
VVVVVVVVVVEEVELDLEVVQHERAAALCLISRHSTEKSAPRSPSCPFSLCCVRCCDGNKIVKPLGT